MEIETIKKVKLDVNLTDTENQDLLYQNNYVDKLHIDFIKNREEKRHNINSHSNWFNKKIKLNHEKENLEIINKWKLCMVDYGMNIGTEINGIRPSIIFKSSNAKYGEDVIVIPITSCEGVDYKSIDQFDIELEADENNNLSHKSLIKVRQLRCISKKRLKKKKGSDRLNIFGEIVDNDLKEKINFNVKIMLGI